MSRHHSHGKTTPQPFPTMAEFPAATVTQELPRAEYKAETIVFSPANIGQLSMDEQMGAYLNEQAELGWGLISTISTRYENTYLFVWNRK